MTVTTKRMKSRASNKKAAAARSTRRKKTASKKRKSRGKKLSSRKSSKKKSPIRTKSVKRPASRKKVSRKKAASKKATRKKVSKKKVAKKKTTKKKAARKEAPSWKKTAAKKTAQRARRRSDLLSAPIHGIKPYTARRGEQYMSHAQLAHFQRILIAWKRELMDEVDRTVHHMQDEAANFPDPNDRATQESEFGLELRTRDRERKLLRKIDAALARIEDGTYGFCDETGEEIGLKRLEARPVATLCVEAQERREMAERQFRDRDDRYR